MKIEFIVESLCNKSLAFLEVAILSSKDNKSLMCKTSEYSNVTAYLVYHSTELFLKFAICASTQEMPPHEHNIFKLHKKYNKLYPDNNINLPFSEEIEYLGFTEEEILESKKKYSMSRELQLRYPVDNNGVLYQPITIFETWFLKEYKEKLISLSYDIFPEMFKGN